MGEGWSENLQAVLPDSNLFHGVLAVQIALFKSALFCSTDELRVTSACTYCLTASDWMMHAWKMTS